MQPGVDWGLTQFWLRINFSGIGIGMGRRKERRPWHQVLQVLQKLCPHVARMHLCMTWPDTFFPLSRFREVTHLSIYRVASVENFDLPLMAFGPKLVKLELTNCTNFQSGTALNIRKYYSEDNFANIKDWFAKFQGIAQVSRASGWRWIKGKFILSPFLGSYTCFLLCFLCSRLTAQMGTAVQVCRRRWRNRICTRFKTRSTAVWCQLVQVSSLQERLENLQVTMLDVMIKYGNLKKLEVDVNDDWW